MKLSVSHNFAFLCNPKCGSTSIEKAIRRHCDMSFGGHPNLKHINAKAFHRHVVPLLRKAGLADRIETFCIIREPVERVFSWYRYQMRPALKNPGHRSHSKYSGAVSFEEFVIDFMSGRKAARIAKIGRQSDFVSLADGSIGVDKIFRLEDMASVEKYLGEKIGSPVAIPHKNASSPAPAGQRRDEGGLLSSFMGGKSSAAASPGASRSSASSPEKMEIHDELLLRLKDYLAEDYRIYHEVAGH